MAKILVIVIVAAVVGFVGFLVWRARRKPTEKAYYFRCPGCRHKLRGLTRQAGHKGMCSNCKETFTFPSPAQANG